MAANTITAAPSRGLTPVEVARLWRISPDRVRALIRSGVLGALNLSPHRSGKPRFVVLPHHLREFEQRHAAAEPERPKASRRQPAERDYYPD